MGVSPDKRGQRHDSDTRLRANQATEPLCPRTAYTASRCQKQLCTLDPFPHASSPMRSCVILGSGRSGTSMLAGTLSAAGYYMGGTMLTPTPSNPKGYFESVEINDLNNELIAPLTAVRPSGFLGYLFPWRLSTDLLWLAHVDIDARSHPTAQQVSRLKEFTSKEPFCFKDPRFCYTLDAWRHTLNDAVYLCLFREPGRTVSSIRKDVRERYPYERYKGFRLTYRRALATWTSMYQHVLEKHSKEGHWVFLHYDQILDGSGIPQIEGTLDVKVDTSFVDPNLKRSPDSSNLPPLALQIYQRLCANAGYI